MRNKSLFFKLFILLILFITVPVIIISSIINYRMANYSVDAIGKTAVSKLKAMEKLTIMTSDSLAQRALELTTDDAMDSLTGIGKYDDVTSDSDEIVKLLEIQNKLNNLAGSISSLHSVYLYMDNSDIIMTSNMGTMNIGRFADTAWMNSYENFKSNYASTNWMPTRTIKLSKNSDEEFGTSNNVITFFYVFTPYTTSVRGVLVFNIYESYIRKMVNDGSLLDNGQVKIVSSDGFVVSDENVAAIGDNIAFDDYFMEISLNPSNEGYLFRNSDGERQLISFHKSGYNDWIYLGVFQADSLLSQFNQNRTYVIFICISLIIAGILMSYFISKRIYNPLNNLIRDIREKKGIDITSSDSEMAILAKAYENLSKDRERLSLIAERKESNKNIYLLNLLSGKNEEFLDKELTGIDFFYPGYLCAVIAIDRFSDFDAVYSKEQREYMRMFILKISEELLNNDNLKCAGMTFEKNKIALIVNYREIPEEELTPVLKDIFTQIQNETSKITDNTICVGIGGSQDSGEGISRSFGQAQEALLYKLINGYGSVNFYKEKQNVTYYYPFVQEKYILNILNAGTKERIREVIAELIQYVKDINGIEYDNVIHIFNQLIGNTIKYLLEEQCSISMIFGNNYNIYTELSTKETMDDVKVWLIGIYSEIVDYLARKRDQTKNSFEYALEYIHKNYRQEIDLNKMAEYACVSYSYLRKIFRNETGENIINYINSLRINESKRLLRSTSMTIKEISVSLGYNNILSYVRFFKKYEGVTPGEYRTSSKQM